MSVAGPTEGPVREVPVATRWWVDGAVATVVLVLAAALNLVRAAAVNTGRLLSGEEVSVSILDVIAVPARFQPTEYATNFAGHVHFCDNAEAVLPPVPVDVPIPCIPQLISPQQTSLAASVTAQQPW